MRNLMICTSNYYSSDQIKKNEMDKACSMYWGRRGVHKVLMGKPEGKRSLGRPRHRWEDIKVDHQEVGWGSMDWIVLAQDRDRWWELVNVAMNLQVP
jgi:hypothetical protein